MIKTIAWTAFILGFIGGAGLVGVGLATVVMILIAIATVALIVSDIKKEGIPNRNAILGGIVLSTIIVKIGGPFFGWIGDKLTDLWNWLAGKLGEGVEVSTIGLSIIVVGASMILTEKFVNARTGR